MRRRVLVLVACCGCRQVFGLDTPQLEIDAATSSIDSDADQPVETMCLGAGNFVVCVPKDPPARYEVLASTSIDTSAACPVVDSAHPTWCIVAAQDIKIDAPLAGYGSKELVIVALHDLDITAQGAIFVNSPIDPSGVVTQTQQGAGANSTDCSPGTDAGNSGNGGGGGAGATFGTKGGNGGKGNVGATNGGTSAGVAAGAILIASLRGGCKGGAGGAGGTGGSPVPGGFGGGAVYVVAGNALSIAGAINASGAGGLGGNASKGGGSGGGSGGMIALWGATVSVSGTLFANGGGGGGGADNGAFGGAGGVAASYLAGGAGGAAGGTTSCTTGPGCGGDGASGNSGGQNGTNDATVAGGGGGGGGGGVIHVVSGQPLTGNTSPGGR